MLWGKNLRSAHMVKRAYKDLKDLHSTAAGSAGVELLSGESLDQRLISQPLSVQLDLLVMADTKPGGHLHALRHWHDQEIPFDHATCWWAESKPLPEGLRSSGSTCKGLHPNSSATSASTWSSLQSGKKVSQQTASEVRGESPLVSCLRSRPDASEQKRRRHPSRRNKSLVSGPVNVVKRRPDIEQRDGETVKGQARLVVLRPLLHHWSRA